MPNDLACKSQACSRATFVQTGCCPWAGLVGNLKKNFDDPRFVCASAQTPTRLGKRIKQEKFVASIFDTDQHRHFGTVTQ